MFKTFRNKVFAIYVISILVLLIGSLTFVYVRSYNEMRSSINQRLNDTKDPSEKKPIDGNPDGEPKGDFNSDQIGSESLASDFDFDDARDITITKDEDLEETISEYIGDQYVIDYEQKTIVAGDETYVFNQTAGVYKIVKITYDLQYIESLKTTLLIFGTLVLIAFSSIGFILITKLVAPLEQSYKVQNRFVSDASHELKTPLAIIKSCLDLIASGDEDQENMISYCQEETDRLIRLTSNLLQLSESDTTDYAPLNVSQNLELLISGIEVGLFEKNIKLETKIMPNITAKMASDDINQLTHILIDNAVKYNDDRKKLKIALSVHNRHLLLRVVNSSEPVSNENLDHLFDRFYRASQSRSSKGFGLGLSLAKHLTEKYNGEIKAQYASGYFTINVKIPLS